MLLDFHLDYIHINNLHNLRLCCEVRLAFVIMLGKLVKLDKLMLQLL